MTAAANVRNSKGPDMIRRQVAILGLKIFRGLRYIRRGVPTITASVSCPREVFAGICVDWFWFGLKGLNMRGLSCILALGFGAISVVSGIGIPRAYPPEQHVSEVLRRADKPACVNNETNRQCWDGPDGT